MRIALFEARDYDRASFSHANAKGEHDITFFEPRLVRETASLAASFPAVCSFVNDRVDADVIATLRAGGTKLLALRSAGFNHVDLPAAAAAGIRVTRVPAYSPHAVAEHTFALLLTLNRKIHRAYNRVREWNFTLEGLVGFDLAGKTLGIVGVGKIGRVVARIGQGFGMNLLGYDLVQDAPWASATGLAYVDLPTLLARSDVVSLHMPLTPETRHLMDAAAFARMKPGAFLLNTGRGALIDAKALIDSLKSGRLGAAGLDVYEEEEGVFFQDLSSKILMDDLLARLLTFPNVLVTSHQGFLTREALANIAETTLASVSAFAEGLPLTHEVRA